MHTTAVILEQPRRISLGTLPLPPTGADDIVVDVAWSGISTGTERLLWLGEMPAFPGMGYPLVPGYESAGTVCDAGPAARGLIGRHVFVPGARCYGAVRGLFGGAASRVVLPASRALPVDAAVGEQAVLLALAATAYHAVACGGRRHPIVPPELIVGHGVLGRLLARMTVAGGYPTPTVWEIDPRRRAGALGYPVIAPEDDPRRDYRAVYEASGDATQLDRLIGRLAPGGEIVLAGFYGERLSFAFAPAFMREARLRAAAEWQRADLLAVRELVETGRVSLDGLVTHRRPASEAAEAYPAAFDDPACLKMLLDWRTCP